MTWSVEELGTLATKTVPSARIVSRQLLRNILQAHLGYPGLAWNLPHSEIYLIPYASLSNMGVFAPEELPSLGGPDQTVLLIAQPAVAQTRSWDRNQALTWLWRNLFHGRIHAAVHRAKIAGVWDDARAGDWVDRLGWMEYREIRTVLLEENLIAPDAETGQVLEEFLSVVLELLVFETDRVGDWFPLLEPGRIQDLLALVGSPRDHLAASRPEGAIHPATLRALVPEKTFVPADREFDGREYDLCIRTAKRHEAEGRNFEAALTYLDAALVEPTRSRGRMQKAAWKHLAQTLGGEGLFEVGGAVPDWALHWLDVAANQKTTGGLEYQALHAVFDARVILTQKPSELRPWSWLISLGKAQIRKSLPGVELLSARSSLLKARLLILRSDLEETVIGAIITNLEASVQQLEKQIRDTFSPRFQKAMEEASFAPTHLVEKAARDAIIEDMVERLLQSRQLSFGDLRDILARNELKLPDLTGVSGWWHGDPLRKLDKAMARGIPGAYRPGEFYTTGLEAFSSLFYATNTGRLVLLWAILPFLMTIVLWKFPQYMHEELLKFAGFVSRNPDLYDALLETEAAHLPTFETTSWTTPVLASVEDYDNHNGEMEKRIVLGSPPLLAITFIYFLCMLHVGLVKSLTLSFFSQLAKGFRFIFWTLPKDFFRTPIVRTLLELPPIRWLWTLGLKPALLAALVYWLLASRLAGIGFGPILQILVFGILMAIFASRPFIRANAWLWDLFGEWMHEFGIQSLYRVAAWLAWLARQVLDWVSIVLLGISEWLRPKPETEGASLIFKGILGAIFQPILGFLRFAVTVLIEPQINPIKHFPTVTIGHKFMLVLVVPIAGQLEQLGLEKAVAYTTSLLFVFGVPGFFGFMVWELKENWRLYAANRPNRLGRLRIGSHGESFLSLFSPGFHSGTLAKAYRRLRHAKGIKRLRILSEIGHHKEKLALIFHRHGDGLSQRISKPLGEGSPQVRLHRMGLRGVCLQLATDQKPPYCLAYEIIDHRCWLFRDAQTPNELVAKNLEGLDAALGLQIRQSDLPNTGGKPWQTDGHLLLSPGQNKVPIFLLDSRDQPLAVLNDAMATTYLIDLDEMDARNQTPEWKTWLLFWDQPIWKVK